jgi:DNA repair protein RadC
MMSITDWPADERPREKLLHRGPHFLSDAELLAVFLRTGTTRKTAVDIGRDLIGRFGSLRNLLESDAASVMAQEGIGPAKYALLIASLELGRRHLEQTLTAGDLLTSPGMVRSFLRSRLRHQRHEVFSALFLDTQNRLLSYEELFRGTLDSCAVHPREVVKRAIALHAAAVIFAHNHPSGHAEPSVADRQITERLKSALALVDVRVLDHLVVGDGDVVSLAERGWI